MTTRVIVKVHKHGVTTRVRVHKTRDGFIEYCVPSFLFPKVAINAINTEVLESYAVCSVNMIGETFDDFPYPAYLEVDFTFTNQLDHSAALCVSSAKYVDNQKGMLDFTGVFRGSLVSAEIKRKILENLFLQIEKKDVEEIQKIVKNLRTACGGSYNKIY